MANTSYLRYAVEPWVREQLSERFAQPFASTVLALSTGGRREFDAVSSDASVVASIKTHSGLTSGGRHPSGKVTSALLEIYFLTLVPSEMKLLVLTNPSFYDLFTRCTAGQIAPGVLIEHIPLPREMQATVDGVTNAASSEMTRIK